MTRYNTSYENGTIFFYELDENMTAYPYMDHYATYHKYYGSVIVSNSVPFDWALPLYGYALPVAVIISVIINIFMLTVLLHRHLRNPTNYILVAISVNDLLTALCCLPWPFFYYTLGGYRLDAQSALGYRWCVMYIWVFKYLPLAFHSASTWITVYLAIQRYMYISEPSLVAKYCSNKKTCFVIISINLLTFLSMSPQSFGMYLMTITYHFEEYSVHHCYYYVAPFIYNNMDATKFRSNYFWFRSIFYLIPCILLTIFTFKLACTMKRAEKKKRSIVQQGGRKPSTVVAGGRNVNSTNKLLFIVCGWILFLEIPAMIVQIGFFLTVTTLLDRATWGLIANKIVVVRNSTIVMSSPVQFMIYCCMSEQFRVTARQYFTKRKLYTVQIQNVPGGGKRYNMIIAKPEPVVGRQESTGFFRRLITRKKEAQVETAPQTNNLPNNRKTGNVRIATEQVEEVMIPLSSTEVPEIAAPENVEATAESAV